MKKLLACLLVLSLLIGSGALAAVAEPIEPSRPVPREMELFDTAGSDSADARLAAVTLKIKNLLNLNTDDYEEFSGNLNENALAPTWSLSWSGTNGNLYISADEDGGLLSLSRYEYDYYTDPFVNVFGPRYPKDESAAALAAAEVFCQNLFTGIESVELTQDTYRPYPLRQSYYGNDQYSFYSVIYLNGIPSPMSMSVTVRGSDGQIMSFYRTAYADRYLGNVPAADLLTDEAAARALLRSTLEMRLEYVTDPENSDRAILRYLPVYGDQYYVDAASGKLVNLSELQRGVTEIYEGEKGMQNTSAPAPEAMASDAGMAGGAVLNDVERTGVEKLEGVLSKEDLAAAVTAAYPEFGLADYTLASASYSVYKVDEVDRVACTLTFSKKMGDGIVRRMVSVDAKTAEFESLYTYYPWQENYEGPSVTVADAEAKAEAFLEKHYADAFAKVGAPDVSDAAAYTYGVTSHSFYYTREENGYRYTYNALKVSIDPVDGTVANFSKSWNDNLTFESPEGIVDMDAAIDAYLNAYLAEVSYIAVPFALDGGAPEYRTLMEQGYGYFYTLTVGYQLTMEKNSWFSGVDAKSGAAVVDRYTYETQTLRYDDLAGSWAKAAIERLAAVNVGYTGGKFEPAKALTQLDLVALLVSTNGYGVDLADEKAADNIYNYAYSMGLLRKTDRDDDKVLSRIETVRLMLDASGYGRVAKMAGIFTCSFGDVADIPADLLGYAAIAQGLGILRGNSTGLCLPNATATRAEAAAMLDQFMSR